MRYGAIYIAHNPRDGDNTFKVGKTERTVEERMKELTSATATLGSYTACAYFVVNDIDAAEEACHKRLNHYRVQDNREFFELPLARLIRIVKEEVQRYVARDFSPEVEPDDSATAESLTPSEMLKAARKHRGEVDQSWDEALARAKQVISEWFTLIRNRALQAAAELRDEDILQWEISETIEIGRIGSQYQTLCSVLVVSRFSKEPLALWRSDLRGGIYGDLDLSRAIDKPHFMKSGSVRWKELDDGRVGRVTLLGYIDHDSPGSRERGRKPSPRVIVRATPIEYDDYHQNFKERSDREKSFSDPTEAFEVFLAVVVENAKTPQYDVRKQGDSFHTRHGESRTRISDGGKFEMGLLED
jgi:hypothetical protein